MMWRKRISSAVLAPRAVRVTPGLPLHPAPTLGLGARPLRYLSFALQWSAMWIPPARRSHLAPSTPVASSSFEGQVKRCLHPLCRRPTKSRSPDDACWPPAAYQQLWPLPPLQLRAWPSPRPHPRCWSGWSGQQLAANLHQGWRHKHCRSIPTIKLGNK